MQVLIILGHPNTISFNHSIAETCKKQIEDNGHTVLFHDLYAEEFNPVHQSDSSNTKLNDLTKSHFSDIKKCDALIVIHPNWWGQPPAIIKGWMDRILIPGVAYDFTINDKGDTVPVGILKAGTGLIINTSNTPDNFENDVLETIWKKNVLNICGIKNVKRLNFGLIKKSDQYQRVEWLSEVKQLVNTLFPLIK
nr:NAD(P)H-dependent oxidoreductase [uncultured Carboxylicivirga sp.]